MTAPLPSAPHAALPPPPDPGWNGPSAWPRPPRWLGIGTIARLTRRELRDRRIATWSGVATGLVAGAALGGAFGGHHEAAVGQAAALVLLVGAAALADTTDPAQRDDADLLLRLGCPRLAIRFAAWAGCIIALGLPAAVAAELTHLIRASAPDAAMRPPVGNMSGVALLLVAAGAATTAGTRLTPRRGRSSASTVWNVLRALGSVVLIVMGALLPSTSTTGSGLDFSLAIGLFLVVVGLVGLAPVLVGAAVAVTRRLPSATSRVSAATLAPQRRGLTLTVSLVASLAALLVVQATLGTGLGARERARVAAVRALGPATWAGTDRVLVVDEDLARSFGAGPSELGPSGQEPRPVAALPPGTRRAEVELLASEAVAAGGVLGDMSSGSSALFGEEWGTVARATPGLLEALGLDPELASGDRALVLDRRVLHPGSNVRLVTAMNPDAPGADGPAFGRGVLRPATKVTSEAAWVGLPPVLLPQGVWDSLPAKVRRPRPDDMRTTPNDQIFRYRSRPTEQQRRDLERAFPDAEIHRGSDRVDLARTARSDKTSIISVRNADDVRELAVGLAAMAALVLGVALLSLRLAVRREEAVLHLLGARRRTRAAVSAVRGASIAAVATAAGALISGAATRWGIHWYDTRTRLDAHVVLAPIGWRFPAAGVLALVAIPLLAGAIGAALSLVGPSDRTDER